MKALAAVPRETPTSPTTAFEEVLLELVDLGDNPRIDPGELEGLTASILELGVLDPVKVTAQPDGRYRLVWGQRRVLASRLAGKLRIPALVESAGVLDVKGGRRSIEQLSENLQRKDMNPIEEAVALREVLDGDPGLTQEALADRLGRSRPWVSNTLGLLEAAPAIQVHVREGRLTASHVKALRGLAPTTQLEVAKEAISRGSSAHATEELVQQHKRSEEWRKEREAAAHKEAERLTGAYTASIEKKLGKQPRDVRIVISTYSGNGGTQEGHVANLLRKAGFTNVTNGSQVASRSQVSGCDCDGWKVETAYDGVKIVPGCFDRKHLQARTETDDAKRRSKYALEGRVQARLKAAGEGGELASASVMGQMRIHLTPLAARMALWGALGWHAAEWAEARGGKRSNPWPVIVALDEEQLAAELGKALPRDFRDANGYHVDWATLATELGVEPAETPTSGDA